MGQLGSKAGTVGFIHERCFVVTLYLTPARIAGRRALTGMHDLLLMIAICLTTFASYAHTEEAVQPRAGSRAAVEEFDVLGDGDALLLSVHVNSTRYLFSLDTGSTLTVFDHTLKRELNPTNRTVPARGLSSAIDASLHDPPRELRLGNLNIRGDLPVGCVDLKPAREASGHDIYGIVGMAAMSGQTLQIDFDRGKLFILSPIDGAAGERFDLHCRSGIPEVAARSVLGTQMWNIDTGYFLLDSGSLSTVDFGILLARRPESLLGHAVETGLARTGYERTALLGGLSLGSYRFGEVVVREHAYSPRNVLGLAFWSRFNITFDFPHSVMYLQRNHNFERPDRIDLSGARFVRRAGKTVVDVVDDGSASEVAGLRAGDVILSVRGQDASTMRLFLLRQLCCTPGEKIEMSVMRGDRPFGAEIVLPGARATGKPATDAKTNARGKSGQRSTKRDGSNS